MSRHARITSQGKGSGQEALASGACRQPRGSEASHLLQHEARKGDVFFVMYGIYRVESKIRWFNSSAQSVFRKRRKDLIHALRVFKIRHARPAIEYLKRWVVFTMGFGVKIFSWQDNFTRKCL